MDIAYPVIVKNCAAAPRKEYVRKLQVQCHRWNSPFSGFVAKVIFLEKSLRNSSCEHLFLLEYSALQIESAMSATSKECVWVWPAQCFHNRSAPFSGFVAKVIFLEKSPRNSSCEHLFLLEYSALQIESAMSATSKECVWVWPAQCFHNRRVGL